MLSYAEKKRRFLLSVKTGDIVSIRGEDWMGKTIRWVTESNVNHTALYLGNGLIIESTLGYGVRILPIDVYLADDSKQVYLSRIIKKFDAQYAIEISYNFYGLKYDLLGQIGILTKYLVKKINLNRIMNFWGKNKASESGVWCSEFIGEIFAPLKIKFTDEDTTYLTPGEIFNSSVVSEVKYADLIIL